MTSVHRPDDDGRYADVSAYALDDDAPEREPADREPDSTDDPPPARTRRTPGNRTGLSTRRKATLLLIGAALGLGLFLSVYQMGTPSATLPANHPPVNAAAAAPTPVPLNEPLVAELTAKAKANPSDALVLRGLAEEYFRVGDFKTSATWQAKVVELNPGDKDNRLILGVTYYNDAQYGPAEQQWLAAAELDPKDPGPWYNLGFLYLSLDPPQDQKAEAAWQRVVELAPQSDMAKTVSEHLDRMNSAPVTSPAPSSPAPNSQAPTTATGR